jgi:hypothetical protein
MPRLLRTPAPGASLLLVALASLPAALAQTAVPPLQPDSGASVAPGVELPAFQPGLWEYRRQVLLAANPKAQESNVRKCSDPSSEIRRTMLELQQKGCQFSSLAAKGNQYRSSWTCPVPGGVVVDRNVVTVKSETSYQDDNEVRSSGQLTRSTVVATRLGDCPAQERGATEKQRTP